MFEIRVSGPDAGMLTVGGLAPLKRFAGMNQVGTLVVPLRMCPPVSLVTPLTTPLPRNCWQSPLLKGWLPAESARYELMKATRISEMKTANGLSERICFSQLDSASGSVMIRYMTPQKYREMRRKNGISSDTSPIEPPSRATMSAAPVLNIDCRRMAGISSSQ